MAMHNIALSTSWQARRGLDLAAILDAIVGLDVRRIEINGMPPVQVSELPGELARRGMSVPSLHDPTPWPIDAADELLARRHLGQLSSLDEQARTLALEQARQTIATARSLGAQAVVIHLGAVDMPNRQRELFELMRAGRDSEFIALRDEELAKRASLSAPYLERALVSIRELGALAATEGIALGVEVRDGYHQIPNLAEFEHVFAASKGLPVYYWHDTGHAHKQGLLGLATQEEYLRRFRERLLGIHLHDAILDHDHYAPGCGQLDLAAIARLLPSGILRTLELNNSVKAADAERGLALLVRLGLA